jgi:hypothetical protein
MRASEHVPRSATQRAAAAARDLHGYTVGSHASGRPDRAPGVHWNAIEEMIVLRAAPGGLQCAGGDLPPTAPREADRRGFGTQSAADTAATRWAEKRARANLVSAAGGDENDAFRGLLTRWRLAHARLQQAVDTRSAALHAWELQSEHRLRNPAGTAAEEHQQQDQECLGLLESIESTEAAHALLERCVSSPSRYATSSASLPDPSHSPNPVTARLLELEEEARALRKQLARGV